MEYKTEHLYEYMKKRSKAEKQKWGLSIDYLEGVFDCGGRTFFGVQISDDGMILSDDQQPYKGFFSKTLKGIMG